jgi:hypothetical protein
LWAPELLLDESVSRRTHLMRSLNQCFILDAFSSDVNCYPEASNVLWLSKVDSGVNSRIFDGVLLA